MATAGRILIMPRGNWANKTTYEMLDLVKHNGTSWLAKKTSVGIEPSNATEEYWQNVFDMEIANNLAETEPGKALDATQGKKLFDAISNNFIKFVQIDSNEVSSLDVGKITFVSFEIPTLGGYKPLIVMYASNPLSGAIVPCRTSQICGDGATEAELTVINLGAVTVEAFRCKAYCMYIKTL